MRRHPSFIGGLLAVLLLWAPGALLACGDKFLVVARGTRFQRGARTAHAATVLIYAPPDCASPRGSCDVRFQSILKQAGYPSRTVGTSDALADLVRNGGYDIVVADLADARAVERLAALAPSGPVVLPVYADATPQQLNDARKTWGTVLKAPATRASLLDAVDEASRLRNRSAGRSEGNP
jgi:hypothetical protein